MNDNKEIFVFGSNLAGRHGAGSAKFALENCGAIWGRGFGMQGYSYAIPTKDENLLTLSLVEIEKHIDLFVHFVMMNRHAKFAISRIGTGLAGYDWDRDIRPLFPREMPKNCRFLNKKGDDY